MIFIFSSPRSGSTWLAKAFDSHPDTLYLHEPDIVDKGDDLLPHWFDRDASGWGNQAGQYLSRLATNRNLRTVGTRPFFRKTYRSEITRGIRTGVIHVGKGLERVGLTALMDRIEISDMASGGAAPRIVIKSVSALGRAEAFLKSAVPISPILLLRHPCAYVHSYMRGNRMGVMPLPRPHGALLDTRSARRLNTEAAIRDENDVVERLAWQWLVANSEAHKAISQAGGIILRYEDLAADPNTLSRSLFAKLGLDWSEATAQFFRSTSSGDDSSYYSLARDPVVAANKWRSNLDDRQIEKIRSIVSRDAIGQQYFP
jgi:Sulfotransferase family